MNVAPSTVVRGVSAASACARKARGDVRRSVRRMPKRIRQREDVINPPGADG
jgi:hypothetical protein